MCSGISSSGTPETSCCPPRKKPVTQLLAFAMPSSSGSTTAQGRIGIGSCESEQRDAQKRVAYAVNRRASVRATVVWRLWLRLESRWDEVTNRHDHQVERCAHPLRCQRDLVTEDAAHRRRDQVEGAAVGRARLLGRLPDLLAPVIGPRLDAGAFAILLVVRVVDELVDLKDRVRHHLRRRRRRTAQLKKLRGLKQTRERASHLLVGRLALVVDDHALGNAAAAEDHGQREDGR
eukprot:2599911-Prymnesium_polylepis.1